MSETRNAFEFPWYQAGSWETLEQGDLIPDCPVLILPASLTALLLEAKTGDVIKVAQEIQFADLIVLSQSCDLVNDKIEQVLLCAHFPASAQTKANQNDIRKERMLALHMIEKCELEGHGFERRVVDFRTIYTLPKAFVAAFAAGLGLRVRLLSPYKEHLSQAFARYFMRVGLPRPLEEE